jgi:hypothetical protein
LAENSNFPMKTPIVRATIKRIKNGSIFDIKKMFFVESKSKEYYQVDNA